jgi:hypothetical protein
LREHDVRDVGERCRVTSQAREKAPSSPPPPPASGPSRPGHEHDGSNGCDNYVALGGSTPADNDHHLDADANSDAGTDRVSPTDQFRELLRAW